VNREFGNIDLDTLGFAPSVDGLIIPQHPFHPSASKVSADVPVMIEPLAQNGRACLLTHRLVSGRGWNAGAVKGDAWRRVNGDDRPVSQIDPRFLAFRHLLPDRQRLPLLCEDDENSRTPGSAGKGPVYLYYFTWETQCKAAD